MRTYEEYSVKTPAKTDPNEDPRGAPAAKVANAIDFRREGAKDDARIPNDAGIEAAAPIPCKPRNTSMAISLGAAATAIAQIEPQVIPIKKVLLAP